MTGPAFWRLRGEFGGASAAAAAACARSTRSQHTLTRCTPSRSSSTSYALRSSLDRARSQLLPLKRCASSASGARMPPSSILAGLSLSRGGVGRAPASSRDLEALHGCLVVLCAIETARFSTRTRAKMDGAHSLLVRARAGENTEGLMAVWVLITEHKQTRSLLSTARARFGLCAGESWLFVFEAKKLGK